MAPSTPLDFSLYAHLTQFRRTGYPATELIKFLIQAIAHDVCLAKRNSHTLFSAVERARDVYDAINMLIDKVSLEPDWSSYDKYTAMIDPLEE